MIKTNLNYLHSYFKSVVIALGVLCFANFQSSAQQITTPFPETDWSVMMRDPNVSFFETKARFNEFWSNRPMEKGKGFKAFKRWEWFNEPRVNPQTGAYPEADAVWQAMQDSPEMFTLNENMLGDWTYIGNTAVPNSGGGAGRVNSVRSLPGSTTTWFACTPGGGLWKTTNSGGTWSVVGTDFLSSIGVSDVAIDYTNTNVMYIATGDGDAQDTYSLGVLKTTDGGLTWNTTGLNWNVTQTRTCSRIIIHPTNPQILICATSNGVWRTTNGGTTWAQEQSGDFVEVTFKPNDPSVVYGVSDQFYRSTNTGDTWNLITSGLPSASNAQRMAMATTIANSSYLYILVSGNDSGLQGVYRSVDGGTTFSQRMGSSPNLLGWSTTGNDNGGQGWYDLCMAADPVNAEIIYTGGVNIWKSTNGGTSFTQSAHWYGGDGNPYVHADHHFLGFVTGTTRLISGNDGGVFSTTNGGSTWSDQSSNLQIAQQYRLSVADLNSNLVITGWQDNGTNLKNGVNHTQVYGGDGMECIIDPNNSSIMYATLYYGSIQRSTNGGASWSNIVGSGGSGINSDGAWVTPFVLGTNSTHIYVGKDVVYKSTNSGSSWTALGAIGGGNCNDIAVAPSNNNYIYVSKESTLYRSTDGNTFTELTNAPNYFITDIAIHPTNPNTVWITLSNYDSGEKIYRSTDAGATWVNISSGLPNIPANAVVYQEGTSNGIYIGMDAGVYYRDDVLGSWTPFMNALPNVEITELEIHYATNTITASTYGRGLWRAQLYALPDLDAAFIAATQPTGTYCDGDITPIIEILNSGNTAITSLTINYQVSGQSLLNYNWTGSLATGNTATITLPTLNYGAGSFTINFNIVSVNGTGDENSTNNIGSSTYTTLNATNNAVLTLLTDCYPNETSWAITDENANVIYSGSGYPATTSNVIPVCLPDGCFKFTIFDSYGDGMTSGSCPSGSYEVRDALTNTVLVLMTTAGFGTSASHNFCYPIGAIAGCTDQLACNYDPLATEDNGSCTYGQANDVCAGAISLTVNAAPVSANNLSTCSNGPNPSCGNQTGTTIRDVWFKFIYEGGPVVITTNHTGETMDTRLAVFTACGGTQIACNDDVGGGNTRSTITIACGVLTAGNTYYIQAGGYANLTGNFKIQVTAPVELCNGLDDDCDGIIDEGFSLTTYYRDLDNDGFGNLSVTTQACSAPSGYVSNSTDCNDNNAAVRPGATEVCNGIDDDCDGQIDEDVLLTFYRDFDNDGFGNLGVTTQACSAPAGYVSNSTDCNDNNAAVRPGAIELCNGIDDDCDGQIDEGCNAVAPPVNDGWANATPLVQSGNIYPNCSILSGTCAGATDSPESVQQNVVTGEDVWYKFNAVSTAARIRLLNPAFDGVLELYTNTGVLVESENLTGLSSEEAMNTSGLTQGNQYYLAVRNYNSASGNGNFSLCVQHLMPSSCAVEGSNMELCSNMKPQWTGANQYVFTFTSVENSTVTTGTSSSQLPMSTISLGLRYGSSYIAGVEAVYHLADGTGNTEVIQLPTSNTCIIQINPHPEVKVKDSQVCPSIIFRNSLLQYKPFVCGATDFDIRFTQIDGSGNPVGLPFVVSRGAAASTLHLSFINPQPLQAGARYSVEVRPVFSYGVGEYGSPRCIHISSSSMNEGDLIESPPILKSDLSIDQSVIVYPNPTIGDAINIYDSEINSIHITDCYGRKISGYVLRDNKNDMVRIEFSQRLSSGLYLLVIETENDKKMVKLIVER